MVEETCRQAPSMVMTHPSRLDTVEKAIQQWLTDVSTVSGCSVFLTKRWRTR